MNSSNIKVLLIEDNSSDARLIEEYLINRNDTEFEFFHASRLSKGIEYLKEKSIDIILLDLCLPDSEGLESFSQLYQQAPSIPIVVLTGNDDQSLAIKALQSGAQDYVIKNFINSNMIARVLRYTIERYRMKAELEEYASKLKASEHRIRTIIDEIADGLLIVDKENIIRFVNPSAESILNRSQKDLLDTKFEFIEISEQSKEIELERKGPEKKTIEMKMAEIDWNGEDVYLINLRDITQRRKAEEASKRAEALQSVQELAGAVAHEFSQPLTVMSNAIYLMELENVNGQRTQLCKEMLNRITELVQNLRSIIKLEKQDYLSSKIIDIKASGANEDRQNL